jgi:hypothetical protein
MVSVGYYWSYANLGLLVMTGVDSLLLIAFIVCAVTLGKPMSFLNCYVIGKSSNEVDAQYAYAFVSAAAQNLNKSGSSLDLRHWAGVTRTNCFQAKTVWGMAIALWYVLPLLSSTTHRANTSQHLVHCLLRTAANSLVQEQEACSQDRRGGVMGTLWRK